MIVNGPVSSRKTSYSFTFEVRNIGMTPITVNAGDIVPSVEVNGTPTGTVSVSGLPVKISPGAKKKLKLNWSYSAGAVATGDSVVFNACVNVASDIVTSNDCDSASTTAK